MTNNTNARFTILAVATCCGFSGSLAAIELHSCTIEEFGGRCEDFPCCGHTDGGGCQTTPEMTTEYYTEGPGAAHLMCDHEAGVCDAWDEDDEEDEVEDDDSHDEVAFAGSEY